MEDEGVITTDGVVVISTDGVVVISTDGVVSTGEEHW
jgi:hypothetical protein